ncbi:MAG: DUF1616 domain-containing protein [Candidatus Bathyarchaeia archaeon]
MNTENDNKPFLAKSETVQLEKPAENQSLQETLSKQDKPQSFQAFFKTNASNYLLTLTLAVTSMTSIFVLQNTDNLLRAFSGLLLTLGLPGYALMKAVFPPKTLQFEKKGHNRWLFTGALSVVMSIVVVSMTAFMLDLTPIGVTLMSLNLSLFMFTLVFVTVGLWRQFSFSKKIA